MRSVADLIDQKYLMVFVLLAVSSVENESADVPAETLTEVRSSDGLLK